VVDSRLVSTQNSGTVSATVNEATQLSCSRLQSGHLVLILPHRASLVVIAALTGVFAGFSVRQAFSECCTLYPVALEVLLRPGRPSFTCKVEAATQTLSRGLRSKGLARGRHSHLHITLTFVAVLV
jgi:hypothetical protein